MNNKPTICSENTCTLCKACVSICPVGCVALEKDVLNNEYAVKGEKCINCNLCEKVCPANKETELNDIKKCYAAWSLNSITRKQSASGGIATELYRYELQHMSGAIVGVSIKNNKAIYTISEEASEIKQYQNSKYTLGDTNKVYREVKERLKNGESVTFIGVPCHVAGLKNYLKSLKINIENLFCVDLVCHGCVSPDYLQEHVQYIKKKKHIEVDDINFRNPLYGTENFVFTMSSNGKVKYKKKVYRNDAYQVGYHKGVIYRDCCYSCKYAKESRVGDISLADFSGVGSVIPTEYTNKNVSCILANSKKGIERIKKMHELHMIYLEERPIEEETNYERQLHEATELSEEAIAFRNAYARGMSFDRAIFKACFKRIIKNELKWLLHIELLKKIISKMLPPFIKRSIKNVWNKHYRNK